MRIEKELKNLIKVMIGIIKERKVMKGKEEMGLGEKIRIRIEE